MRKATTFVSALALFVVAIVAAVIGGAVGREGHEMVAWIFAVVSLGSLITSALVMMEHGRKAQHVATSILTTSVIVAVMVLSAQSENAENTFKAAIFGVLMWIIGFSLISGRFFAKVPRPSRCDPPA